MASDLIIRIGAESKEFQEELSKISAQTESLEGQLADLAKVSGVAFAALIAEAGLALHAFAESEAASNKLTAALQSQGIYSAQLAQKYKDQAKELQKLTGVDDDAIVKAQASLQAMIGQTEISEGLTKAILDLSAAKGMDLDSTAQLIAKGINGQTVALKKLGIEIDEHLSKEERTAQIVERVGQAFGGQAAAANQGLGSIKGLKAAFSDIQEEIGSRLAPTVTFIIQKVTELFAKIADNKPLLDLVVSLGVAGATVSGLALAIGAGALAFFKFKAAMEAAGIATNLTKLSIQGLIGATGIGLLVVLVTELALNWNTVWPKMQAIFAAFVNNISALGSGLGKLLTGIFTFSPDKFKEGLAEIKGAFAKGLEDFKKIDEAAKADQLKRDEEHSLKQNDAQAKAAAKRAAEEKRRQDLELLAFKSSEDAKLLKLEQASAERVKLEEEKGALYKSLEEEKNQEVIKLTQDRIDQINYLENLAREDDAARSEEYFTEILDKNAEYQALTVDQRAEFIDQNQQQLIAATETRASTMRVAALKEVQEDTKRRNTFLAEELKFGIAYATINRVMHSEIYSGSKQAFGNLAELTTSSNSTLKGIGKAAAVANIAIKTAESAMAIFAGFSSIPIIGIALGIAGAAAAVAFGGEQIAKVTSAADGGIMTGGIAGQDSIPTLTMPGELVVPTRNFSEVVNAVATQRSQSNSTDNVSGGGGGDNSIGLAVGFDGLEAERVITARQVEARALKTYRSGT